MTHPNLIFIGVLIALTITDNFRYWIPNIIILPAIALGCYLTGNWIWAGMMLLIGMALLGFYWKCPKCGYTEKHITLLSFWAGGDVKLLTLTGAFLGWQALVVGGCVIMALIKTRQGNQGQHIAVAPYFLAFSVLTILATKATSLYLLWSR